MFNNKEMAYQTILAKKSVISSLVSTGGVDRLSAHPLVRLMLKAIGIREAAKATPVKSIWSIQI